MSDGAMIDETKRQEWIDRLRECEKKGDPDYAHSDADQILCEVLNHFGLNDLLEEYSKVRKWYA